MSSFLSVAVPFRLIMRHLDLLKSTVIAEIMQKYAGSIFGLVWVVLYPMLLFCIYSVLYLFIFRVKPNDMSTNMYLVYIMSGLVPFLGFSESLSSGTVSLTNKKSLLLNTIYPSEFIPLQAVLSSHISLLVGVFLLILANLLLLNTLNWTVLLIPYIILLQILFTVGIVWILAILNLLLKDIQYILAFITMLLMIISPIAYTPEMVPNSLKFIMYLNPFSYFVWSYQSIFVYGVLSYHLISITFCSLLSFFIGYSFYISTKKVFYEFA